MMINETSTQWSEQCTVKSCNVFILQNNLKETQIEEECAMKKGRLFCIVTGMCYKQESISSSEYM